MRKEYGTIVFKTSPEKKTQFKMRCVEYKRSMREVLEPAIDEFMAKNPHIEKKKATD